MSTAVTTTNTSNQLTVNYDTSKIFLWAPKYQPGVLTNLSGGDLTYPAGTLIGRISANQEFAVLTSGAVDGSQLPVGVLAHDVFIADTESADISIGVGGEVAEEKIIFDGADDFDTVVSGRSLRDRIAADTVGIKLVTSTENTRFDN